MGIIGNALGAIVLGALGWVALEFPGRPVRGFFDLRRQVKTQMLRFEQVALPLLFDDYATGQQQTALTKARSTFSNLSDELIAFGQSEWLAAYFVKRLGFDPIIAGRRLAVAVEELCTVHEDREANYRAIDRALKF